MIKPDIAKRLESFAGKFMRTRNKEFRAPKNPAITRREAIQLAEYIKHLEFEISFYKLKEHVEQNKVDISRIIF